MEKPKRARKRKPETSQGGPEATNLWFSGGQGVHREVESEGIPAVQAKLHLSVGILGSTLLATAAGALIAMPV